MSSASRTDKVVFITGVSSGLGRELAQLLLAQGAKVAAPCAARSRLPLSNISLPVARSAC